MDKGSVILHLSFLYGVAVLSPWNAVLSTLDFFENATPNYPISFIITFAINGVMVVVVLLCIAYSDSGSHKTKVNLTFLLTALLLIILPFVTSATSKHSQSECFWITISLLVLLGAITAVS